MFNNHDSEWYTVHTQIHNFYFKSSKKIYIIKAQHNINFIFFSLIILKVRTLFVSGLPMDAKPRELYLLFRAYEGYEGSLLKVTSKNGKTASVS